MEYLLGNHENLSSDLHAKAGRGQDWWRGDRRSWRPLTSQPILTSELPVPRESLLENKTNKTKQQRKKRRRVIEKEAQH